MALANEVADPDAIAGELTDQEHDMDIKKTLSDIKDTVSGTLTKGVDGALDAAHLEHKRPLGGKLIFLVAGIGVGVTIGAGLALLFAPTSGKELRVKAMAFTSALFKKKQETASKLADKAPPVEAEAERLNSHARRARNGDLTAQPS